MFFYGPLYLEIQVLVDKQELISVQIQGAV